MKISTYLSKFSLTSTGSTSISQFTPIVNTVTFIHSSNYNATTVLQLSTSSILVSQSTPVLNTISLSCCYPLLIPQATMVLHTTINRFHASVTIDTGCKHCHVVMYVSSQQHQHPRCFSHQLVPYQYFQQVSMDNEPNVQLSFLRAPIPKNKSA